MAKNGKVGPKRNRPCFLNQEKIYNLKQLGRILYRNQVKLIN